MARTVSTGSVNIGSAPSSRYAAYVTLQGNSWAGYGSDDTLELSAQWGIAVVTEHLEINDPQFGDGPSGSWTQVVGPMEADILHKFRARDNNYGVNGSTRSKKTAAILATTLTPSSTNITSTSADISCSYVPNVGASPCTAQLEYKRTVDTTWLPAGSPWTYGGYTAQIATASLASLLSGTQYNVRLRITRDTQNVDGQELISPTHSFATLAGIPVVTTNPASSVGYTSAILNGHLDINSGVGVNVYFKWGETPSFGYQTPNIPMYGDGTFQATISPLIEGGTRYYFQAYASFTSPSGSPVSGSVLYFDTQTDPGQVMKEQEMLPIQDFERKWGVATTLFFVAPQDANSSSDQFFSGAAPWGVAGVRITKVTYDDDKTPVVTGPSATTNLPVQVSGSLFRMDLEVAEMQADEVFVSLANSGTSVRDILLRVTTRRQLSQIDVDATTGSKPDTTAFLVRGHGAGHGMQATGGATGQDFRGILAQMVAHSGIAQIHGVAGQIKLAATANANSGYYTGQIVLLVGGQGAGQARAIISYDGGSKVAVVDSSWTVNPLGADTQYVVLAGPRVWDMYRGELTAMIADNAPYGDKMQLITQRFSFKIDQSATVQRLFKSDNSVLATRSVSDAAGVQIIGKLS